jgi:hypothetical protein
MRKPRAQRLGTGSGALRSVGKRGPFPRPDGPKSEANQTYRKVVNIPASR